jgi:hypothetical protein
MKNVALAALLAATALQSTGCVALCGAYEGSNEQLYVRDSEMIIMCSNGGIVANLLTTPVEGRFMTSIEGAQFAIRGEDGELAFDWVHNDDGTVTTPQLDGTAWTQMAYDEVTFDHAHIQCVDLESRAWWNQQ